MQVEDTQIQGGAEDAKAFEDALTAGFDTPKTETEDSEKEEVTAEETNTTDTETEEGDDIDDVDTTPEVKLPQQPSKHPDLKEGDYVKSDTGKYVVKAEHLAEDITSILNKDAGIFLKIARAKPEKAEAIANILGISADDTRSSSQVLADVIRSLQTNKDQQKNAEILQKHLPYLVDRNAETPFVIGDQLRQMEADEKPGTVEVKADTNNTDVDLAIYRLAAESKGKLDIDTILNSQELATELQKYKFNPETGAPLSAYERLSLAAKVVFANKEAISPDPIGGARAARVTQKQAQSSAESELEKALMGAFK